MKILVTGAAGFIGFHLIQKLLSANATIVGIDNINDYYDVNLKYDRLMQLGISRESAQNNLPTVSTKYQNFSFQKLALEDTEGIEQLFEREKFDVVCNLAAQAGVRYSLEQPLKYINSNVVGFTNILESCRKNKVSHLVYASSSSVYGINSKIPFETDHHTDHPVSLYAATKKSNELLAHVYSHIYGLPTTGLRFFTVYGPWGRPDMAYFSFTKAIMEGTPIKVFNNGNLMRDFTYIDDIVDGIMKVLYKPAVPDENFKTDAPLPSSSSAPYKIYNIGNNNPVQLLHFINILENELGKEAVKEYHDMQPGDVYATFADIDGLSKDFNYQPTTSIEAGLKQFVNWYKNYYKTAVNKELAESCS